MATSSVADPEKLQLELPTAAEETVATHQAAPTAAVGTKEAITTEDKERKSSSSTSSSENAAKKTEEVAVAIPDEVDDIEEALNEVCAILRLFGSCYIYNLWLYVH
jgi:biopolymer transport protein ExbD